MNPIAEELRDKLLDVIKEKGKEFWDAHADVRASITDRIERLGELAEEYLESDEAEREEIKADMARVKNTVELLFDSVALDAAPAAKAAFKEIVNIVLEVAIKVIPIILSAV